MAPEGAKALAPPLFFLPRSSVCHLVAPVLAAWNLIACENIKEAHGHKKYMYAYVSVHTHTHAQVWEHTHTRVCEHTHYGASLENKTKKGRDPEIGNISPVSDSREQCWLLGGCRGLCGRPVPSLPWVFSGQWQPLECLDSPRSRGSDSLGGLCYLLQPLPNH